jgi:hypothetical protein
MTMRDVDSSNVQHHVASPWRAQYRRTDEADYETSQEASECADARDPGRSFAALSLGADETLRKKLQPNWGTNYSVESVFVGY